MTHPAETRVFFVEPTGHLKFYLIRVSRELCTDGGCHAAHATLGVTNDPIRDEKGDIKFPNIPHEDPRWPTKCDRCAYVFRDGDGHSTGIDSMYGVPDEPRVFALKDAPPGAMWDATWFPESWRGPDGKCLQVRLPGGKDWVIDGPAQGCPDLNTHGKPGHPVCGWTRTGELGGLTVRPSIDAGNFHGFLTNGVLRPV